MDSGATFAKRFLAAPEAGGMPEGPGKRLLSRGIRLFLLRCHAKV